MKRIRMMGLTLLVAAPALLVAQDKGKVLEEIVARVNNDIITTSDYQKSEAQLHQEVAQDCRGCPQAQQDAMFRDRQKDLLRDLIDQSLLVQRGKDMGLNVETQVIKQLDRVRQDNNLSTMEDLQKAVEGSGLSWEDYKNSIRNNILTQEVIRREVGDTIQISNDEVKKYYEDHKSEFVRPEQVLLKEIFVNTAGKTPEETAALEKKAQTLLQRIKAGEDFGELAKRYSDGATKDQGGDLGEFEPGQLAPELNDLVFKMKKNDVTGVLPTKNGFEILKVVEHYEAGQQPLSKVEGEISNRIYMVEMQPALRAYLKRLREESYLVIKPGYIDTSSVGGSPQIEEVQPTPDQGGKSKGKKPKKNG